MWYIVKRLNENMFKVLAGVQYSDVNPTSAVGLNMIAGYVRQHGDIVEVFDAVPLDIKIQVEPK